MDKKLEKIQKLAKSVDTLTPENLDPFLQEVMQFFEETLYKLDNGTPKEKEEALNQAYALREILEEKTRQALEVVNLTAEELETFSNNPENFTKEEWESLQSAKLQLQAFQKEAQNQGLIPSPNKKGKKKKKSAWIAS